MNHRPAILPVYRKQIGNTAGCASVLKQHCIPISPDIFHQSSLSNTTSCSAAGFFKDYPSFIGSIQGSTSITYLSSNTSFWPFNKQQIDPIVFHQCSAALTAKHHAFLRCFEQQLAQTIFLNAGQIRFQLHNLDVPIVIHKKGSVFPKQKRHIMKCLINNHSVPSCFCRIVCRVDKGFAHIMAHKACIKSALSISKAGSPLPFSIGVFAIFQTIVFMVLYGCENIRQQFPMSKVFRAQNRCPRHKKHSRGNHIVCVIHANHIRIRHICYKKRFFIHISHSCTSITILIFCFCFSEVCISCFSSK